MTLTRFQGDSPARRVALIGVFTALAMIFSYIEAIIPLNFGIPGVKLGIANIVVVAAIYVFRLPEAAGISFVRIFLMGLLFGNVMSLIFSFAGGILSFAGMTLCKKLRLSVVGVSTVGGVLHNVGQLLAAMLVLNSAALINYMPVLLLSGLITGFLIGFASHYILKVKYLSG